MDEDNQEIRQENMASELHVLPMDENDQEIMTSQLDIPPMDWEYMAMWDSWYQGINIFNLDDVEELEVSSNTSMLSGKEDDVLSMHEISQDIYGQNSHNKRNNIHDNTKGSRAIKKSKTDTVESRKTNCPKRTVQESDQVMKTESKRKASDDSENVPKRRALKKPCSKIRVAEDVPTRKEALAKPLSERKTSDNALRRRDLAKQGCETRDSDNVRRKQDLANQDCKKGGDNMSAGQSLPKPDWKMSSSGNVPKKQFLAKTGCAKSKSNTVPRRREDLSKQSFKITYSDNVPRRQDFAKPGCKTTDPDCAPRIQTLAKPGCKMIDSDAVSRKQDLTEPIRQTTYPNDVPSRHAMAEHSCHVDKAPKRESPKLEEIKQKLQDSYNKATKRSIQLLDYRTLPKPAQGIRQQMETHTTMNPSLMKTAPLL